MKGNKGFILLDALCAFTLLSTSILFFNKMIYINNSNTQKINDQIVALNYLREHMYQEFEEVNNDEYQVYYKEDQYCCKYEEVEECIYV